MSLKSYWKVYRAYLKADTREEAIGVLDLASGSMEHLVRLSVHFCRDYGRLPDHLHNMILLSGGDSARDYLSNLSGSSGEGTSNDKRWMLPDKW